jgi:hypothetical protein
MGSGTILADNQWCTAPQRFFAKGELIAPEIPGR